MHKTADFKFQFFWPVARTEHIGGRSTSSIPRLHVKRHSRSERLASPLHWDNRTIWWWWWWWWCADL